MPITLAESKVGMADKVYDQVIDEFRRDSFLLDKLVFDNAISPGTGGSTLVYGYQQLKSPSTAKVRKINEEYAPSEAKREKKTAEAKVMGGSFEIDRVIQDTSGALDEMAFQLKDKIKATTNYFHNCVINGTSESSGAGFEVDTFDGLKKLLANTDTAYTSAVDISSSSLVDSNYNAFLDEVDAFLRKLDGKPTMLLMNSKMLTKMTSIARRAGYYSRTETALGTVVDMYNGIPMIDAGQYYNGSKTVDVIEVTTPTTSAWGTTAIYAINIGLDGFHGISPQGDKVVKTFLPDMTQPGAVKKGEVELIAGVVLKNTKKAGVLKDIKIEPKSVE